MRYVCLLTVLLPAVFGQASTAEDGATIYKERCAKCHDSPTEKIPSLATIKAMSGEGIYVALTSGAMKTQAEGL